MPAVKIGRLATHSDVQGKGLGSELLDYIKDWFTTQNKTGCRFIVVDAYNNEKTLGFYSKNGFTFSLLDDEENDTRLMVYDLSLVRK